MIRRIMSPGLAAIFTAILTTTLIATTSDLAWAGSARSTRTVTSVNRFCPQLTAFHRDDFPDGPRINNRFFPFTPGTQFVYEGRSNTGGGVLPHQIIFTVTDMVKYVDGVRTRVAWDQDLNDGQLSESELAFHAQDRHGNVWVLGEYPEEFDDTGAFTGAPFTWIAGQDHAQAGTLVPGDPRLGTPAFLEGSSPSIDFLDCGQVFAKGQTTTVPTGTYKGVLIIDEDSPLDPTSGHQRKEYAPGTGLVRVGAVGDPEGETLVLIAIKHLSAKQMASIRTSVRKLEKRAYQISKVYQHTPPAFVGN
jgi:hypothetical protein